VPNPRSKISRSTGVSDVRVPMTVPEPLAVELRRIAERDCNTIAATARRLLALSITHELATVRRSEPAA